MIHITKVKLFNGELRYAVVEPFKSIVVVKEKSKVEGEKAKTKVIEKVENLPVEYKSGNEVYPAVFPLTEEGLEKAKEIQALFKNNKKSSKK